MNALPSLLEEVAEQAKYYDVTERALIGGRRRRRRNRLAMSSAAVATSLAVLVGLMTMPSSRDELQPLTPSPSPSPLAPMPTACEPERLILPGIYADSTSWVQGGDPTGNFLVGVVTPVGPNNDRLVIWDSSNDPLLVPTKGEQSVLHDVTSRGIAVGTSVVDGRQTAWQVRNEKLVQLPGLDAAAYAINERGDIVGQVRGKPVIWRNGAQLYDALPLPPGPWTGVARGIRDDGTIVGYLHDSKLDQYHVFVWQADGSYAELAVPTGFGTPAAMNMGGDWVVAEGKTFSVRWNLRTGAREIVRGISALAINRHGWVGGTGGALVVGDDSVQLRGSITDYPKTISPVVTAISDEQMVLGGTVIVPVVGMVAVRWRCS